VELIATMEAGVDFAEDDVSVIPDAQILARIAAFASRCQNCSPASRSEKLCMKD